MTTKPWRRVLGLLIPVLALGAALAVPATAGGAAHPYFNDHGTLTWYHSLAEAQQAAREQQKLIFIEYGRKRCGNCRTLCNRVLPHARIRDRIANIAVGLVAECDRPESKVYWLFKRNLHNARMLPFVAFVTPKGGWVTGFAGYASVQIFDSHLRTAERTHRRIFAGGAAPAPRAPAVAKATPKPEPTTARRARPAPRVTKSSTPAQRPARATGDIGCPDGGCGDVHCCPPANPCIGGACAPGSNCCPGGDCDAGSFCVDDKCCAPNRLCIPGIGDLRIPGCSPRCPPKAAPAARTPAASSGHCDFPPPAPRIAATPEPPSSIGSPDGVEDGHDAGAGAVPPLVPAPGTSVAEAAAQGDWGTVVRATRTSRDAEMIRLNRQAHAWAHGQLAAAVQALQEGRYADAQRAVKRVAGSMRGEPEAVDADRGAAAIELVRDLQHLAADSPLRTAVRKNAYEKMRGTRWAPLFNDCATPSRALSAR